MNKEQKYLLEDLIRMYDMFAFTTSNKSLALRCLEVLGNEWCMMLAHDKYWHIKPSFNSRYLNLEEYLKGGLAAEKLHRMMDHAKLTCAAIEMSFAIEQKEVEEKLARKLELKARYRS